jgi:hypothetical protein
MTVTNTKGLFPTLLSANNPEQADALLFLDGEAVYARLLPDDSLRAFENEATRHAFEREYGEIADRMWAGIRAAISLIQAIERPDPRHLKDYAAWQATAEVKAEVDLANQIVRAFRPEVRKYLSAIPEAVQRDSWRTHREEQAALRKRILTGEPLVAISELLFQINRWVRKARFVMFMDRHLKKPLPGLYCPDPGTALAALVFNRVPTPKGLGVCRNPSCGKSFLRIRPGQQYHSTQCGSADRKARQRSRERNK